MKKTLEQLNSKKKKRAAKFSIFSNITLIILKFTAGAISGSIGIISEAIHSSSDLLASFIAFFSISESSKPADGDHQFGHGKYEDMAGLIEGLLIIFAAFYIFYESIKKILYPSLVTMHVNVGLWVMMISVIANTFVSRYLLKVAKETDSVALYADGEHLRTDIYSSLAVFFGLFAVKITANPIYDPIIAIIVAIIIFSAGHKICENSKNNLLDVSLSESENSQIKSIIIENFGDEVIEIRHLRTRKTGMRKNIELILTVEHSMHISKAHKLCDKIEAKIDEVLHNTDITIHLEPSEAFS